MGISSRGKRGSFGRGGRGWEQLFPRWQQTEQLVLGWHGDGCTVTTAVPGSWPTSQGKVLSFICRRLKTQNCSIFYGWFLRCFSPLWTERTSHTCASDYKETRMSCLKQLLSLNSYLYVLTHSSEFYELQKVWWSLQISYGVYIIAFMHF